MYFEDLNYSFCFAAPDEVVLDIHVFGAAMVNRIVDEVDRALVVFVDGSTFRLNVMQEGEQLSQVCEFSAAVAQGDVLSVAGKKSDYGLLTAVPRDRRAVVEHDVSARGSALDCVVGPV